MGTSIPYLNREDGFFIPETIKIVLGNDIRLSGYTMDDVTIFIGNGEIGWKPNVKP